MHSTCPPSSHEASDYTTSSYSSHNYSMLLATAQISLCSYSYNAGSFSGTIIRDSGRHEPYLCPPLTGIAHLWMSEGDNIGAPTPVYPTAAANMTEQTTRGCQQGSDMPQLS